MSKKEELRKLIEDLLDAQRRGHIKGHIDAGSYSSTSLDEHCDRIRILLDSGAMDTQLVRLDEIGPAREYQEATRGK